jgi:hypothetical protein
MANDQAQMPNQVQNPKDKLKGSARTSSNVRAQISNQRSKGKMTGQNPEKLSPAATLWVRAVCS